MLKDAKKFDHERTASEFDANYYRELLEKVIGRGICYLRNRKAGST